MRTLAALLAALMALYAAPVVAGERQTITGPVRVHDGDTWAFTIRPAGIDAPELRQVCEKDGRPWKAGREAQRWLRNFLHRKTVTCTTTGEITYDRMVATCSVDGQDLGEIIVRAGWAYDYIHFSRGKYAAAEADAREHHRGIWAGKCEKPWEWRRKQK